MYYLSEYYTPPRTANSARAALNSCDGFMGLIMVIRVSASYKCNHYFHRVLISLLELFQVIAWLAVEGTAEGFPHNLKTA